jgi:hypothetical protein
MMICVAEELGSGSRMRLRRGLEAKSVWNRDVVGYWGLKDSCAASPLEKFPEAGVRADIAKETSELRSQRASDRPFSPVETFFHFSL